MKNCIIWSPKKQEDLAQVFWNLFGAPVILSHITEEEIEGYNELLKESVNLIGAKNVTWFLKKYDDELTLLKPNDLDTFSDILKIVNHSGGELSFFSNDICIDEVKKWMFLKESESKKNNITFLAQREFAKEKTTLFELANVVVLHGFNTKYDSFDYVIVSNSIEKLNKVLEAGINLKYKQLPDFSNLKTYKKNPFDTGMFYTDFELVLKNRSI